MKPMLQDIIEGLGAILRFTVSFAAVVGLIWLAVLYVPWATVGAVLLVLLILCLVIGIMIQA